jgi:hypothetical protein
VNSAINQKILMTNMYTDTPIERRTVLPLYSGPNVLEAISYNPGQRRMNTYGSPEWSLPIYSEQN